MIEFSPGVGLLGREYAPSQLATPESRLIILRF